jgi:uncharacterized DUF497 family protein
MRRQFEYHFEWDPIKARRNLQKHGVAFERASGIFADPRALSNFDVEHSRLEDRWITLGLDRSGILLVVCHTFHQEGDRQAYIRMISARKATRNEINQYKGL